VTGDGEAPHLTGTLATVFFLGDRTRLFVDVGESQPLMLETAARRDFRRGESIGIRIDPAGLMQLEGAPC